MKRFFRGIFRRIKKIPGHILTRMYCEEFFLLILLFSRFFDYGQGLFHGMIGVTVLYVLKLIFRVRRRIFLIDLMRESKGKDLYILFALSNLFLSAMLIFSWGYGDIFPWEMAFFAYLYFWFEQYMVQYTILREVIEETGSLGEPQSISILANDKTIASIGQLISLKDSYLEAVEARISTEKMKTQLIANISHDLKTPLTSIVNYADILGKKDVMDDEARTYVAVLGRNSKRLKSLIVDLIEAAKTGTGNVSVEKNVVEFNELVSQIYGDFDSAFEANHLEFVYTSDTGTLKLYTDGDLLARIVQNLISNALKYSLPGTRVYARSTRDRGRLYFSMKNVSREKLNISADELMEQFTRGDKSRTREGSGLGLYIAKNLAEILGGECRLIIDGDFFQVFVELPLAFEEYKESVGKEDIYDND